MRATLILTLVAVLTSASAATSQEVANACFAITLGEPFWRASETVPVPAESPPSAASFRRGTMTRFRLEGDGDTGSPPADLIVDLDAEERFGSSDWMIREDELHIWWGPTWSNRTFGGFRQREGGSWEGDLVRQTDHRVLPDPGEWRYSATLSPIECPDDGTQPTPSVVPSFADSVAVIAATLESVVQRLAREGFDVSESMKVWWDAERTDLSLSPRLVEVIRRSYPGIERVNDWGAVLDCPDDESLNGALYRCQLWNDDIVVILEGFSRAGPDRFHVPYGLYSPFGSSGWSVTLTRDPPGTSFSVVRLIDRWGRGRRELPNLDLLQRDQGVGLAPAALGEIS